MYRRGETTPKSLADFLEHSPPQVLRFGGQPDALIVGEPQPTRAELLAEYAVLGLEIRISASFDPSAVRVDTAQCRAVARPTSLWHHYGEYRMLGLVAW